MLAGPNFFSLGKRNSNKVTSTFGRKASFKGHHHSEVTSLGLSNLGTFGRKYSEVKDGKEGARDVVIKDYVKNINYEKFEVDLDLIKNDLVTNEDSNKRADTGFVTLKKKPILFSAKKQLFKSSHNIDH